jgi:hypothetical protein
MYFSTPDGIPNAWPQGLFNGTASYEIMPSTPGGSTYSTDFAVYDTTHGYYYARGPMAISLPSTDSDGNGCPDALQVNRSFSNVGTATTSEYASPDGGNSWFYYGERSYTFTFNRNAGSALGSFNGSGYDPTSRSTSTFSGGFSVEGGTGGAVYNPSSRSITFGGNSFSFDTSGSGTSTYTRISDDQVSVAQFNFVTSDGYTRVIKAFTLNRSGGYYRAYPVELVDGDPRTSYVDFKYCHVEILDNNDADADGIPDLSDSGSKLNQSITFNSLPAKTYGDASFSLSASSSSGLGVSYSTSDSSIASVSGSTITIRAVAYDVDPNGEEWALVVYDTTAAATRGYLAASFGPDGDTIGDPIQSLFDTLTPDSASNTSTLSITCSIDCITYLLTSARVFTSFNTLK